MPVTHTIEVTEYTFDELSEGAKEDAIHNLEIQGTVLGEDWDDCLLDGFRQALIAFGFKSEYNGEPKILYSANSCQGDGLSFFGEMVFNQEWEADLEKNFSGEMLDKLKSFGFCLQQAQEAGAKHHSESPVTLKATISHIYGMYVHSNTMEFDVFFIDEYEEELCAEVAFTDEEVVFDSVKNTLRGLADYFYKLVVDAKEDERKPENVSSLLGEVHEPITFFENGDIFSMKHQSIKWS